MDGDREGPVDLGVLGGGEDILNDGGLKPIEKFIRREEGTNVNFSLLAVVPS